MLHIEKTKSQHHGHVEKGKKNKEKLKWRSKTSKGTDPDFKGERAHFKSSKATEELSFVRCVFALDILCWTLPRAVFNRPPNLAGARVHSFAFLLRRVRAD